MLDITTKTIDLYFLKIMIDKFDYHDWWEPEYNIRFEWR